MNFVGIPTDPVVIAGGFAVLVALIVAIFMIRPMRWILLSGLMFVAILGSEGNFSSATDTQFVPFAFPIGSIAANGRVLCAALLIALVAHGLLARRGTRRIRIVKSTIFLIAFQIMYAIRLIISGEPARGILALVTFLLMAIYFGTILPKMVQTAQDVRKLAWVFCGAAGMFSLGTCYQMALNREMVVFRGRFLGISGNPNHAAYFFAISLPPAVWLLLQPQTKKSAKLFLSGLIATMILFLLWTGSRGGLGVAVIGVTFTLRQRIGSAILYGALVAGAMLLIAQLIPESLHFDARIGSTTDTRSRIWANMWGAFLNSPLWGNSGQIGFSENSYLAAAANFGIMGLGLIGAFLGGCLWDILWFQKHRRKNTQLAGIGDLMTGAVLGILFGAMFEAILLGILTYFVYAVFIYLNISAFLRDQLEDRSPKRVPSFAPIPGFPPPNTVYRNPRFR